MAGHKFRQFLSSKPTRCIRVLVMIRTWKRLKILQRRRSNSKLEFLTEMLRQGTASGEVSKGLHWVGWFMFRESAYCLWFARKFTVNSASRWKLLFMASRFCIPKLFRTFKRLLVLLTRLYIKFVRICLGFESLWHQMKKLREHCNAQHVEFIKKIQTALAN